MFPTFSKLKMHRNCWKMVTVVCVLVLMFLLYLGTFQFLQEGTITLHGNLISSARYFKYGQHITELHGLETEKIENNFSDSEDDSKNDAESSNYDTWNEVKRGTSKGSVEKGEKSSLYLGADVAKTRSPKVVYEKVMKILDFNHRTNCPLNYSFHNCEYSACEFTNISEEADLVMINGARLKILKLPQRRQGQLWMMYTKEPPHFKRFKYLARKDFIDQVNWTRCIFRDSTFRGHYGALERRPPPDKDYEKIYAEKKYQAVWFVSHCNSQSRRDDYVKRMLSEIDVHIFGKCGNRTCGSHGLKLKLLGTKDDCLDQISAHYKFYLSFENSMCSDYVTEKFYKLYENIDVIPVVRGGANYTELAPAGSYINAGDFRSPEELGKYLMRLSEDKQEYIRMLKIKDGYINTFPKPPYPCELCKALHTRRHVPSTYENIYKWMTDHCWEPNDL